MTRALAAMAALGALLTACGGEPAGSLPCDATKGFCGQLTLPPSYTGKPVKLIVGLYQKLDDKGPAGPPEAVAMQALNPMISPTMPLDMKVSSLTVSGDYFLYIALYNEGGGMFVPVKGVDWVAQTASPRALGGASSPNLGTFELALAK